jgi:hypothetical protein
MPVNLNISQRAALNALIDKGETAEAAKFLASLDPGSASGGAESSPAPPPPPREPNEVIFDLFGKMAALLGNHPDLAPLIAELETVIAPKPPTPTPTQ